MKKIPKITIGRNLSQILINKKISLTELSQRSRVQMASLSRIVNNKMTGTLECHLAIAEALGVPLEDLYRGNPAVNIKASLPVLVETFFHNDQAYYEIVTKNVNLKKMLPLIVKIEAGGKTDFEQGMLGVEKFIYVLEGAVDVVLGEQSVPLKKETALYFDASSDHYIKNPKTTSAKILCVRSPVKL